MDLGKSDGGLPPDHVVEDRDTILEASAAAIDRHHDPGFGAMVRIAFAPTSLSPTRETLRTSTRLPPPASGRTRTTMSSLKPNHRVVAVASMRPAGVSDATISQSRARAASIAFCIVAAGSPFTTSDLMSG